MEPHFDLDTALEKATVDHSSIVGPIGWQALIWILGKGELLLQAYLQRGYDAGVLTPQGGTTVDNATMERTVVSHRNLREKMRLRTWYVRSMNQGKLDIVKREMERIDVNMLGVSEMKWTGMGHYKSDNHEVYYCGQDAQRRNGVAFICTDEVRRRVIINGIQPCK